jgi:hypothetical protein
MKLSADANFDVRKRAFVGIGNAFDWGRALWIFVQELESLKRLLDGLATLDWEKEFVGIESLNGLTRGKVRGRVERRHDWWEVLNRKI